MTNLYWTEKTGFFPYCPPITALEDTEEDIVIIGAGLQGLFLGIELKIQGRNCLILDDGIPGVRSAIKGDGMLFCGPTSNHKKLLETLTIAEYFKLLSLSVDNIKIFKTFVTRFNEDKTGAWCDFKQMGGIRVAMSKEENQSLLDLVKMFKHWKVEATPLDEGALRNIANVRWSDGAIYIPNECSYNPLFLINGLISTNIAIGNRIMSGFRFYRYGEADGKVHISDAQGNVITCKQLILCLNAFSYQSPIEFLSKNIRPLRTQYIVTPQLKTSTSLPPYVFSIDNGANAFRVHDNRVLIGGTDYEHDLGVMADFKVNKSLTHTQMGRAAFHLNFIENNHVVPDYTWSKLCAISPDNLPIVGKIPGHQNVYTSCGFGVNSSFSFISAAILAEVLTQGKSKLYGSELFDPARFLTENTEPVPATSGV